MFKESESGLETLPSAQEVIDSIYDTIDSLSEPEIAAKIIDFRNKIEDDKLLEIFNSSPQNEQVIYPILYDLSPEEREVLETNFGDKTLVGLHNLRNKIQFVGFVRGEE